DWIGIPSIVVGELLVGFLAGVQHKRNEEELAEFLGDPVVEEIPVDRPVARIYAEVVMSLRRAGSPLPTNDVWIAAATARVGSRLLTFDEHFRAIERIGAIVLRP